jgi:hypothetical protein
MAETKLFLPTPRKASGEPIYTLGDILHTQFESVLFIDPAKPKEPIPVVTKDKKGEVSVGSGNLAFIGALLISVLSGRGDVPDGLCMFVAHNADKMAHLRKYQIVAKCSARGGTYEGAVGLWLDTVVAKSQIVGPSLEKYPVPKRIRNKAEGEHEPELVDVVL